MPIMSQVSVQNLRTSSLSDLLSSLCCHATSSAYVNSHWDVHNGPR